MSTYESTPDDLPEPDDDGATDHVTGMAMPALTLTSTDGGEVDLGAVQGRWVLFLYPSTGVPGQVLPIGWDDVPGARGCTPEACGFRDNIAALRNAGATRVYGLSMQSTAVQAEAVARLQLPYPLLSDEELALGKALRLPIFELHDVLYYRRMTFVVSGSVIEHVFYPIFPTDTHAAEVTAWLQEHQ